MKKMGLQTANALYRATIASAAAYAAVKEFDEAAKEYYEEALKLAAGAPPAAYARGNSKYECAMCGKKSPQATARANCTNAKRVKLCRHCYLHFYLDSKNEIAIADGATTA